MAVIDMTQGKPTGHLVNYAVPLVLGNVLQLSYNAFDAIIVGRFIGKEALAATGMASPVMNLLILGVSGLTMGAGVLMSECFGARDFGRFRRALATTLITGLIASVVVAATGILFAGPLLTLLNVPAEAFDMTGTYLRITFVGLPLVYGFNALMAALKSAGDSKTPLKYLSVAIVANAALDAVFIGGFGFGIDWAALTDVLAQGFCFVATGIVMIRRMPRFRVRRDEWRVDRALLGVIWKYGSVTALQQSIQPICKLIIQSAVNTLGVDVVAAFNAVTRVDDFAFTPQQSISHGITTYVAQNRGAGRTERIRPGFRAGLRLEFAYWVLIGLAVLLLNRPIMRLFVTADQTRVVDLGCQYLTTMALFYIFPSFTNGIQGFFRGMGNMSVTLVSTFIQASLRAAFTWLLIGRLGMYGISFACAIGWAAMLLFEVPYYFISRSRDFRPFIV
ncbi:MATE family efflux transporter [Bifidobacterium avesanii]|uniref:Probable multidrug resistance protein NorM n=1 Tax=Bifidobacterium avesanii TaxID=1798157 RepID=A0A7K3TIV8_9BIFI|nr:MATE family efflux transporter [Bifidobacterium avesanii]KAB8291947.1 MATE family efflux transporter [Bifidobacterium avesanii]NEG79048.1 MATE family efflux transporter [Bifidobacterium avesanii]